MADEVMAWSAEAPTLVRVAPGLAAEVVGRIDYHRELTLASTPVRGGWCRLVRAAGRGHAVGYVSDQDVRRWIPDEPLVGVGADEVWLDIELEEQTLAVYRGDSDRFSLR